MTGCYRAHTYGNITISFLLPASGREHIAHLRQQCHNSKLVIFQTKRLNVLKCYTFLWLQRRHNCSPAASFRNSVMTLCLLKSASANVSFYTSNSKMSNFELWHSCRKWARCSSSSRAVAEGASYRQWPQQQYNFSTAMSRVKLQNAC